MCVFVCMCVYFFFSVILRYKVEYQVLVSGAGFGFVSDSQPAVFQLRSTSAPDCSGNQTSHPDCEMQLTTQITEQPNSLHDVFKLS